MKGVVWKQRDKRWVAQIRHLGKQIHIGSYHTKEEAIEARQKKVKELFGEFINDIEKPQLIEFNLNIPNRNNITLKLNINIDDYDEEEIKQLEKELEEIISKQERQDEMRATNNYRERK